LIGLTSLWINGRTAVEPELNRRRAVFVLGKIDEILSWEKTKEQEKDARFAELGEYLCEVRSKQYWRLEKLKSFDEFLAKRFPESRRKAYYLMAIHENLTKISKQQLREVGWSKATELVKVARKDGEKFDCATWLHKAKELPKEGFKGEVERHLTGKETEPWEIVYFKLYKSQLPVVEKALETAGLMLGTDKSRGYCLEMICADFLAGANLEGGDPGALVFFLESGLQATAPRTTAGVSRRNKGLAMSRLRPKQPRVRLAQEAYDALRKQVLARDNWRCQNCGASENLQIHHIQSRSKLGHDSLENLITLCAGCHERVHFNRK